VIGGDPTASLRAKGAAVDSVAALGRLVREQPSAIAALHEAEVVAGSDVLVALTADTIPVALHHIGMAFRTAALTRGAVDLAIDASKQVARPMAVAGVLGNAWVTIASTERAEDECSMHAVRLVTAGCDLIIARGFSAGNGSPGSSFERQSRRIAIVSAVATRVPTWAHIEASSADRGASGEPLETLAAEALDAGAEIVLIEVPNVEVGVGALRRVEAVRLGVRAGVLLGSTSTDPASIEAWAQGARALSDAGARAIGGGAGTTPEHVAALANALPTSERSP
jgi:5-methyltetrahydrofolate--homocysteine methyltransferase